MRRWTGFNPSAISGKALDLTVETAYPRYACEACCSMGAASSPPPPPGGKRSPVCVSMVLPKEVELLIGHQHGHFHCLLRLVEIGGLAGPAAGFPRVPILFRQRHFPELRLAEPERVPLVGALPKRLAC